MAKEQELDIAILGRLDPSVMQAVNAAKAQLKSIGADARTSSEVMKRLYSQMFDGMGKSAKKGEREVKGVFNRMVEEAKHAAHSIQHSFEHAFGEIGKEVMKGFGFGAGFGVAGLAGKGIEGAKEFFASSLEEAKERQNLSVTLETTLKAMGMQGKLSETLAQIRQFTDYSPFKYATGVQTLSGLLANLQASGQLSAMGGLEGAERIMHNIAEVGSGGTNPDVTMSNIMRHVNEAVGSGRVQEGMLTGIGADIGGSIKPFVVQAIEKDTRASGKIAALREEMLRNEAKGEAGKQKNEELLHDFLIKRKNTLDSQYLLSAFGLAANDPSSPYYRHLEAQADTFTGHLTTFYDKLRDIGTGFGNVEIQFLDPLLTTFNSFMSLERVNDYFAEMDKWAKAAGLSIKYLVGELGRSEFQAKFAQLGEAIQGFFGKAFGTGGGPMFKTITGGISGIGEQTILSPEWKTALDKLASTIANASSTLGGMINAITSNWNTIKDGMILVAAMWGGAKAIQTASALRDFLGKVGLMNVEAGVVNVQGGIPGAGGALAAGETVAGGAVGGGALSLFGGVTAVTLTELLAAWGVAKAGDMVGDALIKKFYPDLGKGQTVNGEEYRRIQEAEAQARAQGASPAKLQRFQETLDNFFKGMTKAEQDSIYAPARARALKASLIPQPDIRPMRDISPTMGGEKIKDSLEGVSNNFAALPDKASGISGSLETVASTFSGLPSKASAVSSAMDSFVAAINAAVAKANASIASIASVHAADMLV